MNRTIHRIGAFLAVLLMLWLSVTGSWIQLLDLRAVGSDASPETDATALSIVEGMYGPNNFAVIQLRDFSAAALPKDFDLNKGVATVLQAANAAPQAGPPEGAATPAEVKDASASGDQVTWVELRMIDGQPVGQILKGSELAAFNAETGAAVTAVPHQQIPQGGRLPYSLRQKLKTLHRFWNRADVPGVYFEVVAGVVLWTLLITGLVVYFQLLKARAKIGRRELFWFNGGLWRGLHRAVSVVAAVFLICIAFTGTWIGYESSYSALHRGAGGPRSQPVALHAAEVPALAATTLQSMQQRYPDMPIKALRVRAYGQMKQGVVITGGDKTDQRVFNAENGQPASLTEPEYPKSNFPFGVQTHENIKHFHSGEMFGIPGQLMNLFAGLSLLFLSISGLVVYFDLWSKRRKLGRHALIWKR